jgi:ABC-2 type transport system ATP-binding protein
MGGDFGVVATGLRKAFGSVQALAEVDLSAAAGSVLAVLGPNGAGKTTTIRILATLLRPDGGTATVAGYDVVRESAWVRQSIGLAGQAAAVDGFLTGRENLEMVGRLLHLPRAEARGRAAELLETFGLTGPADRPARTYSGGMRRRIDLAVTLVGRPRVLFLDEPTSGLDPRSRLGLWELIRSLADGGTTVLLTTQNMDEADQLASRVVVFDAGRIIAEGTPGELKSRLGGDRLQLTLTDAGGIRRAAELLADLGSGPARVEPATRSITLPVENGPAVLPEVVRRLDAAGLVLADLTLRRPTLDDAFLALTGRALDTAEDGHTTGTPGTDTDAGERAATPGGSTS